MPSALIVSIKAGTEGAENISIFNEADYGSVAALLLSAQPEDMGVTKSDTLF